jgi:arylformamidase
MKIQLEYKGKPFQVDLKSGMEIAIPLAAGPGHVLAWYLQPLTIEPVRMGDWVGEVKSGAAVNFRNIAFNPHGHGTHTETVGHISREDFPVQEHFRDFFCFATVVTIDPEKLQDDRVVTLAQLQSSLKEVTEAVIIRTLPNTPDKCSRNYSSTNPAYLDHKAAEWLREIGVKHLMIDTPSVDREEDGGALLSHHAFWNYPAATRTDCTITELIYVPESIADGVYFMNLQVAPFMNDAAPSRPLLFHLQPLQS